MFVAKFTQTTGLPFKADKNSNMPYIGEIMSGEASGTLINGTMFQRNGLEAGVLYACENTVDPLFPTNVRVEVIGKVSIKEYLELRTLLGAPVSKVAKAPATAEQEVI
jgi:hypothetical protein